MRKILVVVVGGLAVGSPLKSALATPKTALGVYEDSVQMTCKTSSVCTVSFTLLTQALVVTSVSCKYTKPHPGISLYDAEIGMISGGTFSVGEYLSAPMSYDVNDATESTAILDKTLYAIPSGVNPAVYLTYNSGTTFTARCTISGTQ